MGTAPDEADTRSWPGQGTFSLWVRIVDRAALRRSAAKRAREDGLTATSWRRMRRGAGDDLRMLFDPGASPAGLRITDSSAAIHEDSGEVTLVFDVTDFEALRQSALERALQEQNTEAAWTSMRAGASQDVVMVLDPGVSPDGVEILDSSAEVNGEPEGHELEERA